MAVGRGVRRDGGGPVRGAVVHHPHAVPAIGQGPGDAFKDRAEGLLFVISREEDVDHGWRRSIVGFYLFRSGSTGGNRRLKTAWA